MRELTAGRGEEGQRLDRYLEKYLSAAPASFIYKMLRKKNIVLNGGRASGGERLKSGDVIRLYLAEDTILKFRREGADKPHASYEQAGEISVIYEDEDLLFVNKEAGVLTIPDGSGRPSLSAALKARFRGEDGEYVPSPVNRIDMNTSGLVLCAKTSIGARFLTDAISGRELCKEYLVLLSGRYPGDAVYRACCRKDAKTNTVEVFPYSEASGDEIITGLRRRDDIKAPMGLTAAEADLVTGRPHQIRSHAKFLGCPVAGDPKYGDPSLNRKLLREYGVRRQMLHSLRVTFGDADGHFAYMSGRSFEAPLPEDMLDLINNQQERISKKEAVIWPGRRGAFGDRTSRTSSIRRY